jgi:hypothetical protein
METKKMRTLRRNARGNEVRVLQEILKQKDHYNHIITGLFGPKTEAAVLSFQREKGLVDDGIVGPITWGALKENIVIDEFLNANLYANNPVKRFSLREDGEMNLTPNFKVREFASGCGSDEVLIDVDFVVNYLQKIREHFEKPVIINSAYRTLAHNRSRGSSDGSQHVLGRAFDIRINGETPRTVARYAESIGIIGIIEYDNFTYIDSRERRYFGRMLNNRLAEVTTFALRGE